MEMASNQQDEIAILNIKQTFNILAIPDHNTKYIEITKQLNG